MQKLNKSLIKYKNPTTGEFAGFPVVVGKSAYDIAVEHGFKGTEEEFAEQLTSATDDADKVFLEDGRSVQAAIVGIETNGVVSTDTLPVGSEVLIDANAEVPAGWETVDEEYDAREVYLTDGRTVQNAITNIETKGVSVGDTLPLESQFYWDKNEEIPAGYVEVTPPFSNPNLLINGDFQVWQRGNSVTTAGFAYTADRWFLTYSSSNSGVTVSKQTDTDGYYAHIVKNTMSQLIYFDYYFDNLNVPSGEKLTLSFWAKGTSGGALGIGADYNKTRLFKEDNQTVYLTNKWQKFVITGTSTDFAEFKSIRFLINSSIQELDLKQVKLEVGSVATPFVPRPYQEELALCQRYYMYIQTMAVRSKTLSEIAFEVRGVLPHTMRSTPTLTLYAAMYRSDTGAGLNARTVSPFGITSQDFAANLYFDHAISTACFSSWIWGTADAEIY